MAKFLRGLGIFFLGIMICFLALLLSNRSSVDETSGLLLTMVFAVCYLAAVVWVAALKIIDAIKSFQPKEIEAKEEPFTIACPNCGKVIDSNSTCPYCGFKHIDML